MSADAVQTGSLGLNWPMSQGYDKEPCEVLERFMIDRATICGSGAILLWSTLALLAVTTRGIPPFETLAISFGVACCSGMIWLAARRDLGLLRQPPKAWAIGFVGLFAYHALYFTAMDNAPPAQAGLISYLWPLLIVLFAALLPGGKLLGRHLFGALMGLCGTALILLGRHADKGAGISAEAGCGYACAFAAAFVWSGYSVANRKIQSVPSALIIGVCGLVCLAAAIAHGLTEPTILPSLRQWTALVGLGLGPVGVAFLLWDHATKHGNLALLGTLSYAAPLLSTALLVATGRTTFTVGLCLAALLIVGGAIVSARARTSPSRPGQLQ